MQDSLFMLTVQSLMALALVLALFALFVWGTRKLQLRHMPQDAKVFKVIQRMSIDNKHSMIEMEHGNVRYVLGLSAQAMTLISTSEKPANPTTENKENEAVDAIS